METVLGPRARVADTPRILDLREESLGAYGGGVVERVVVSPLALGGGGRVQGVEGDEDVAVVGGGDVLEEVHPVGQADCWGGGGGGGRGDVVPG